jgi:hypothetical protein
MSAYDQWLQVHSFVVNHEPHFVNEAWELVQQQPADLVHLRAPVDAPGGGSGPAVRRDHGGQPASRRGVGAAPAGRTQLNQASTAPASRAVAAIRPGPKVGAGMVGGNGQGRAIAGMQPHLICADDPAAELGGMAASPLKWPRGWDKQVGWFA